MHRRILLIGALIMVVIFAVSGCGKSNVVATVNGEQITRDELDERVEKLKGMSGHQGASLEGEAGEKFIAALEKQALDQLIQELLIFQEAKKQGINIETSQIDEHLAKIKSQFPSEEMFQQLLAQQNLTEEDLRHYILFQLTEDALYKAVTGDVSVSEEEVKDYFEKNKEDLVSVKVSHILIKAQEGQVSEEELAKAEEKAKEIIEELNNGADFAELAKSKSEDEKSKEAGGLIDIYFTRNDTRLVREFVEGAFLLAEEGDFSKEPVQSPYGYHIIKLEDKKDTLEELEGDIETRLLAQKKNEVFNEFYEKLQKEAEIEKNLE
ncbi:peptidylprolyl isomerase [Calderihabitans maritimus]|uniref:peptidylprolyl isomerase n=1 Tax=Calderihabitans maritimus TaxID=1246530 RepID=A0A1Z5HQS9_9FIRM|nr:peptidylprolyl isomerase [Calderihabitans maritimus]GAW91665.1 PpiC-type peptidyl-prolyl cis-trans isomerase [Calderihabitans maritimus]